MVWSVAVLFLGKPLAPKAQFEGCGLCWEEVRGGKRKQTRLETYGGKVRKKNLLVPLGCFCLFFFFLWPSKPRLLVIMECVFFFFDLCKGLAEVGDGLGAMSGCTVWRPEKSRLALKKY